MKIRLLDNYENLGRFIHNVFYKISYRPNLPIYLEIRSENDDQSVRISFTNDDGNILYTLPILAEVIEASSSKGVIKAENLGKLMKGTILEFQSIDSEESFQYTEQPIGIVNRTDFLTAFRTVLLAINKIRRSFHCIRISCLPDVNRMVFEATDGYRLYCRRISYQPLLMEPTELLLTPEMIIFIQDFMKDSTIEVAQHPPFMKLRSGHSSISWYWIYNGFPASHRLYELFQQVSPVLQFRFKVGTMRSFLQRLKSKKLERRIDQDELLVLRLEPDGLHCEWNDQSGIIPVMVHHHQSEPVEPIRLNRRYLLDWLKTQDARATVLCTVIDPVNRPIRFCTDNANEMFVMPIED